jgi:hypothetical protein
MFSKKIQYKIFYELLHIFTIASVIYLFTDKHDDWKYMHISKEQHLQADVNKMPFIDCIYFTLITITTVGYGDIVPISNKAKLITMYIVFSTIYRLSAFLF